MSPMKTKVVLEYQKLVRTLQLGYTFDYKHILDMISFIEIGSKTNNPELIQNYFLHL